MFSDTYLRVWATQEIDTDEFPFESMILHRFLSIFNSHKCSRILTIKKKPFALFSPPRMVFIREPAAQILILGEGGERERGAGVCVWGGGGTPRTVNLLKATAVSCSALRSTSNSNQRAHCSGLTGSGLRTEVSDKIISEKLTILRAASGFELVMHLSKNDTDRRMEIQNCPIFTFSYHTAWVRKCSTNLGERESITCTLHQSSPGHTHTHTHIHVHTSSPLISPTPHWLLMRSM